MASSAFARHYLRNHGCFLFLWVLRCFTSPRSLLLPYVFRQRSPDITPVSFEVSLFGDPRIEARLPAPRGLSQVTTSFIGSWCLGIHRLPLVACLYYKDARVHCEVLNTRAVAQVSHPERWPVLVRTESGCPFDQKSKGATEPSGPNSMPKPTPTNHSGFPLPHPPVKEDAGCTHEAGHDRRLNSQCSTFQSCPARHERPGTERIGRASSPQMLLRKEVIQPHLPVRLPCYDLVLIASPTLDGSLHKGWATGFGCYRLS